MVDIIQISSDEFEVVEKRSFNKQRLLNYYWNLKNDLNATIVRKVGLEKAINEIKKHFTQEELDSPHLNKR